MQQIRILLVDDHSLFRDSLSRLLESEPGFVIAGSCARVADALEILAGRNIDVVLLDYDLGDEQGTVLLEEAAKRGLNCRFLMVTAGLGAGTLRAFQNGSAGVFLKHSSPAQLVEAIRKVAAGELWLDSRALQGLVTGATSRVAETLPGGTLTLRERAVVKAVFEGLSNKEIGARLELSESSIKTVLQQLFDKAGVRTRSQLVRIALEQHADDWLSDR
jgi:two-component system nitrate/nitrite response regulator NarL